MIQNALFFITAATMLVLATATVTLRNLFHSALCLLGTLFGSALLFLLLGAEMVALGQVMVYIGGIMIFVLYAVFLTSNVGGKMVSPKKWQAALALLIAVALFAVVSGQVTGVIGGKVATGFASLSVMGTRLLDTGTAGFLIPFELVSVLLLAALVGALAVTRGLTGRSEKPRISEVDTQPKAIT